MGCSEHLENSLYYRCELYCNGSSAATYTAVLGRKYRTLAAVAGVVDTAARGTSTKFEIDVDGTLYPFKPSVGKPEKANVNVEGALQVTIRIYAPATLKSPLEAGGAGDKSNTLPNAALGSPLQWPTCTSSPGRERSTPGSTSTPCTTTRVR